MKNILIVILISLFLLCMGPIEPGPEIGEYHRVTEILYNSNLVDDLYWNITYSWINDSMLIQVWVRKDTNHLWAIPRWYLYDGYLSIMNDGFIITQPLFEYMIIGCSIDE